MQYITSINNIIINTYPFNPVLWCFPLWNLWKYQLNTMNMVLFVNRFLWVDSFVAILNIKLLISLQYRLFLCITFLIINTIFSFCCYCGIVKLGLYQVLKYIFFYHQHARRNCYHVLKRHFYPIHHLTMIIMNVIKIQCHNQYINVCKDHYSKLNSQLQISNYLVWNLCLNLLTMYLVCKKYTQLLLFHE